MPTSGSDWFRSFRTIAVSLACLLLWQTFAQAQSTATQTEVAAAQAAPAAAAQVFNPSDYQLGVGDKIHLTVYGEEDLSGDFTVDSSGTVRLPLVGQVTAKGLSVHGFEQEIGGQFKQGGYLKDPKISVEVVIYRPFYIMGEVNKPGEYPYVNDMSVLNAVALAGGFTYRARDDYVYVRRNGSQTEDRLQADPNTKIHPGDIVRVSERFF